jgi:hypothetical protein
MQSPRCKARAKADVFRKMKVHQDLELKVLRQQVGELEADTLALMAILTLNRYVFEVALGASPECARERAMFPLNALVADSNKRYAVVLIIQQLEPYFLVDKPMN